MKDGKTQILVLFTRDYKGLPSLLSNVTSSQHIFENLKVQIVTVKHTSWIQVGKVVCMK